MRLILRHVFLGWLTAAFLLCAPAQARMIGTEQAMAASTRAEALGTVQSFMARADVQAQLERWDVPAPLAAERVAALSDAELQQLAGRIESEPAAGGIIGIVGVVFVVLLILELVGVTDIFKRF